MNHSFCVYDTNLLIKMSKGNLEQRNFYCTDVNLIEWFRGKSSEQMKVEFEKLDNLLKNSKSEYRFQGNYMHFEDLINSNKPIAYRYKTALKVAKGSFYGIVEIFFSFIFLIPFILYLQSKEIKIEGDVFTNITNREDEIGALNRAIVKAWSIFRSNNLQKMSNTLFKCNKIQTAEILKAFYNSYIQSFNKCTDVQVAIVSTKNFNHNNIVINNCVHFSDCDVEKIIGSIYDFKSHREITKKFYISLYKCFLIDNNKIELNDVLDFYLFYISKELNVGFISSDERFKNLIKKYPF